MNADNERRDKALDLPYDFSNYIFSGIPHAVKSYFNSNKERGEKASKSGSAYDYINLVIR